MKLTRYYFVLALTAATLTTFPLNGNPILPGGSVSPDIFPDPGSVPLLNHTSGTYSFGSGVGLINRNGRREDLRRLARAEPKQEPDHSH